MAYALIDYPNDKGVHAAKVMDESELGPDLSNVTAQPANVEAGIVFVDSDGEEQEGTMPVRSADVEISDLSPVAIPAGSYDGTASAKIDDTEAAKIVPANIKKNVEIFGQVGSYEGVDTMSQFLNATLTKYVNNDYAGDGSEGGAPSYLFSHCYSLEELQMDALKTVPDGFCEAYFTGISYPGQQLEKISFAAATIINSRAFRFCSKLEMANIPNVAEIKSQAFESAGNRISGGGFSLNCPSCTKLGLRVFLNSHLLSVYMPALVNMGNGVPFQGCSKLKSVNMPNLESIGAYYSQGAFENCSSLTMLDFPKLTSIAGAEFQRCTNLATLIFRADSVCTLSNANSFQNSPFASNGSGGTLYVKKSLYDHLGDGTSDDYLSATNWSVIFSANPNNQILPIEGSPYEVTT